jgi:hypothetical protein
MIALSHGEDHAGAPPDAKDENEAGCVGESGEAPRPVYESPPFGGRPTPGR